MAPSTTDYSQFDPSGQDRRVLSACVAARTKEYASIFDKQLWSVFKQDFEGWELQHFRNTSFTKLVELINTLRTNGVYVSPEKDHMPDTQLTELLAEKGPHTWTEDEARRYTEDGNTFESPLLKKKFARAIREASEEPEGPEPTQANSQLLTPHTTTRYNLRSHQDRQETPSPISAPTRHLHRKNQLEGLCHGHHYQNERPHHDG